MFGPTQAQGTPKKLKECNTIVILFVSKPEDIYSLEICTKLEKDILFSLLLDQVPYVAVSVAVLYDHGGVIMFKLPLSTVCLIDYATNFGNKFKVGLLSEASHLKRYFKQKHG